MLAALVVVAARTAPRWTVTLLAGGAATGVAAAGAWGPVIGAVVGLTAATLVTRSGPPWAVPVVAAAATQALFRQPAWGPFGASGVLAGAVLVPVLLLGGRRSAAAPRRATARVLGVLVAGAVAATVALGLIGLAARRDVDRGFAAGRAAVEAVRGGRPEEASSRLRSAERALEDAHRKLASPLAAPARTVPVVGRLVARVSATMEGSAGLARAGASVVESLDLQGVRLDGPSIAALDERRPLLDEIERAADDLDEALLELRRDELLAPVRRPLDARLSFAEDITARARFGADAGRLVPGLLGARGERRYFVALTTPAEARGLGGLMGNWAELVADRGSLRLVRTGRAEALIPAAGEPRTLIASEEYRRRYGLLQPERHPQDVTYSPDLPSVATVLEGLYPQTGGVPVDGTIVLDPYAMAAMLEVTGPVALPGRPRPLTAADAVDFLLREQYAVYASDGDRAAALDVLLRSAFDRLLGSARGSRLGPLSSALAPVVRQQRLALHATDRDEQAVIERLGLDAAFPAAGTGDLLGVVVQNAGNSKLDTYLRREVTYEVRDGGRGDGRIQAEVTIRLQSDAPTSGLPSTVLGRSAAAAVVGTNRVEVSVYTPHRLRSVQVDGTPRPAREAEELGVEVHTLLVDVLPGGGSTTVVFDLEGELDVAEGYRLQLVAQPAASVERTEVRADVGAWRLHRRLALAEDRVLSVGRHDLASAPR